MNEEIEYLTKVFHKISNSPMSIIYKIAQQELNDSQVKIEQEKLIKLLIKFS